MPVSALVLTMAEDPAAREAALASLAADPRLTLGAAAGARLPVVAETLDAAEGEALLDAVEATPGVRFVELVLVDLSDQEPTEELLRHG